MITTLKKEGLLLLKTVADHYNIDPAFLQEALTLSNDRLKADTIFVIISYLIEQSGESNIPLVIGQAQKLEYLGALGRYLLHATTLGQAFEILEKYHQIIHTGIRPHFFEQGNALVLELVYEKDAVQHIRFPAEAFLSSYITLFKALSHCSLPLKEVHFFHPRQSAIEAFETLFQVPVHFQCNTNQLVFDKSIKDFALIENANHNPKSEAYKTHLELLRIDGNLEKALEQFITNNLVGSSPSLQSCAKSINIPSRTIQYRLQQANTTYKKLVQKIRFEKAVELIKAEESMEMVSFLCGFANSPAFYKAFKHYFHLTPSEYKTKLLRS